MNDKAIRAAILPYLGETYMEGKIIEEWGTMGDVIMDIAILEEGGITGFEIKSNHDTLSRLPNQVIYYEYLCDNCYVIVGDKFVGKISQHIPDSWGIIYVGEDDVITLRESISTGIDIKRLVDCLWNPEKVELIKLFKIRGYSNKNSRQLTDIILGNLTDSDIRKYVSHLIKCRKGWK